MRTFRFRPSVALLLFVLALPLDCWLATPPLAAQNPPIILKPSVPDEPCPTCALSEVRTSPPPPIRVTSTQPPLKYKVKLEIRKNWFPEPSPNRCFIRYSLEVDRPEGQDDYSTQGDFSPPLCTGESREISEVGDGKKILPGPGVKLQLITAEGKSFDNDLDDQSS